MLKKYIVHNNKGITLSELMVVSVILILALSVGFSIYFYSLITFERGSNQTVLQNDIRIIGDIISREIRTSVDLEIIDSSHIPNAITNKAIEYLYLENGSLVRKSHEGSNTISKIGANNLSIAFKKDDTKPGLLNFEITNTEDQSYKIQSDIYILNIKHGAHSDIQGLDEGNAIMFENIMPITPVIYANPNHIVYGTIDRKFNLQIENATFDTVTIADIELSGSIESLTPIAISTTDNSNRNINLQLSGTVNFESVGKGLITIKSDALSISNNISVPIYVTEPTATTPTASPESGNVVDETQITLTIEPEDANTSIRYILDSTYDPEKPYDPSQDWIEYDSSSKPSISGTTGKLITLIAYAKKDDYLNSPVLISEYTIVEPALSITAGDDYITISSNYGDVLVETQVASITQTGSWTSLGEKLELSVEADTFEHITNLVFTPNQSLDRITISGTKASGGQTKKIDPRNIVVTVRDKGGNDISKSFNVSVRGAHNTETLTIDSITIID